MKLFTLIIDTFETDSENETEENKENKDEN